MFIISWKHYSQCVQSPVCFFFQIKCKLFMLDNQKAKNINSLFHTLSSPLSCKNDVTILQDFIRPPFAGVTILHWRKVSQRWLKQVMFHVKQYVSFYRQQITWTQGGSWKCRWQVTAEQAYTPDPIKSKEADCNVSRHTVDSHQENELICCSSRKTCPESWLTEPLWTKPWPKEWKWCMPHDHHLKISWGGGEWFVKPFP